MISTDSQTLPATLAQHPPGLYIIATPIGHLRDITLRALDVLSIADLIACEDTRTSQTLLAHYGIQAKTLSYNDHNGAARRPQILNALNEGKRVALISDAGTPLISDPGYKLAIAAREAGHHVSALPGPSSVIQALCLSGLPSDQFFFAGFLPTKKNALTSAIEELRDIPGTLLMFESARRLPETLEILAKILPNRKATVLRELTKRYEEARCDSIDALAAYYAQSGPPKGEIVIAVGPSSTANNSLSDEEAEAALTELLGSMSVKDAATELAERTGQPRKKFYEQAQIIKNRTDR